MNLSKIAHDIGHALHSDPYRYRHAEDIQSLMKILKSKEQDIQDKIDKETDESLLKKYRLSLSVIKAQQFKAEKLLDPEMTSQ